MTYVIIHGRGLQGLGATSGEDAFKAQVDTGRSALRELSVKAAVLRRSTDEAIAGLGQVAGRFADVTGPKLLDEAMSQSLTSADRAARVARVQGATLNMIKTVSPEVMPAAVSRFLAMAIIGPVAGAVVPASVVASAKDAGFDAAGSQRHGRASAERTHGCASGVGVGGFEHAGVDGAVLWRGDFAGQAARHSGRSGAGLSRGPQAFPKFSTSAAPPLDPERAA